MNIVIIFFQISIIFFFLYFSFRLGPHALIAAIVLQEILANLFVLKQMCVFGFHITCSDAFAIGSILGLNILREYYGKDLAKKAIKVCFFFMGFFVVVSQLHLLFVPSPFDTMHSVYKTLLSPAPRLLFASVATFWIVQQFDIRIFGWISILLSKLHFSVRSSLSITISQLLDTVLFSFLGLYGMMNNLGDIIIVSFLVKVVIILSLVPLTALFKRKDPLPHVIDPFP